MGGTDECYYARTELKRATVDKRNNIVLEFTRAVYLNETRLSGLNLEIVVKNGTRSALSWEVMPLPQPSSYMFLTLNISDEILSGAYYDNMILIRYVGFGENELNGRNLQVYSPSGRLYDENGYEVK